MELLKLNYLEFKKQQEEKVYGDDMNLSERLLYTEICDTIENQVDYKMELLEKGECE